MKYFRHFRTIILHKIYVLKACFKTGIFIQGLLHDNSWLYWVDFTIGNFIILKMPPKYVVKMICDWVAANKVYNKSKEKWSVDSLKSWYKVTSPYLILHPLTKGFVENLIRNITTEEDIYKWAKPTYVESYYRLNTANSNEHEKCSISIKYE